MPDTSSSYDLSCVINARLYRVLDCFLSAGMSWFESGQGPESGRCWRADQQHVGRGLRATEHLRGSINLSYEHTTLRRITPDDPVIQELGSTGRRRGRGCLGPCASCIRLIGSQQLRQSRLQLVWRSTAQEDVDLLLVPTPVTSYVHRHTCQ